MLPRWNPIIHQHEVQAEYALQACLKISSETLHSVHPLQAPTTAYLAHYQTWQTSKSVWVENCHSWYKSPSGNFDGRIAILRLPATSPQNVARALVGRLRDWAERRRREYVGVFRGWKGWAENFRRGKRGWWGGLCAVCEECRCTVECGLVAIQHASIKPLVWQIMISLAKKKIHHDRYYLTTPKLLKISCSFRLCPLKKR